ncbi:hypothetical protein D6D29_09673 [Aureobasidium pullulans]|nr:hypothetical protein D6D29_09673 [Aureobasidium pullulans]
MHSIDDHDNNNATSPIDDVASLLATANHARQRPKHIPRHTSNSYMDYALHRTTALRTAIHHLEQELGAHSPISHMSLGTDKLTLHPHPSQSKLSQQELGELQKATHFDKKELQQWYKGFLKDCPSGMLTKEEFQKIYKQFFPFGDPSSFADYVFNVFDADKSGSIDFKEFICALSVTSRGKMEDKLDWAFQLYDIDGDGKISYDEMLAIVEAIYKMVGSMVKLPEDEDTPEKRVRKIFRMMDKDENGSLDMAEFKEGSKRDETIVSALSLRPRVMALAQAYSSPQTKAMAVVFTVQEIISFVSYPTTVHFVASFYLPGVAPTNYQTGDRVPLTVNRLTPSQSEQDTQVRSVFAFDYYHHAFHHCEPEGGPKQKSESLGSILFGDRIQTSPLELYMGKNESCKAVCGKQTFQARDSKFVNRRILQNYNVNWNIDGLPAAQKMIDANSDIFYSPGFALGQVHGVETQTPVLNTHYNIYAEFHEAAQGQFRVVGVLVEPASSSESKLLDDGKVQCGDIAHPLILSEKDATDVVWTYSVYWIPSPTSFATRWDKYLHVYDSRIHWVSLTISAMIVVALVGMVSTILLRTLRKDIARYNRLDDLGLDDFGETNLDDTVQEDSGWKLVHGDVFRPPKHPMILSILVGNGAQLFMMTGFTIAFALLGFLSPSNRGSLTTVMVMLYTFFGAVGGYVSARVYKFFHGDAWKQNIAYTPLLVPGTVFSVFFLLNLFVWARQSSGAVPFTTMLALISIWFLISVPLSVGGSWLGFRAPESTPPVRTNQIPRQIPPSTGYLRPLPSMFLVGILPFGAIFLELYFIISSIWFSRIYYMFGFLFLCYGLMIVTSAAVTILMVYFALCAENYHWQWRAFFTSGASAIYVFLYAMLYWVRTLSFTSWTSGVLYLGYSALISALWFVLTGPNLTSRFSTSNLTTTKWLI